MKIIIEELNNQRIINRDDIKAIKNHINNTYPHLDSSEKSKLLSQSIHNILDMNLREYRDSFKEQIKKNLIKNTLAKNIYDIHKGDIFNTIVNMDNKSESILMTLVSWINRNSNTPISLNELNSYFLELDNPKDIIFENKYLEAQLDSINANAENYNALDDNTSLSFWKSFLYNLKALLGNPSLELIKNNNPAKYGIIISISFFLIILPFSNGIVNKIKEITLANTYSEEAVKDETIETGNEYAFIQYENPHIPDYLKYKAVDEESLKTFLSNKNSILKDEPYFSSIINSSITFNLNPLVLFAIAGHEQGFVPKDHPKANKIANNPFNVFESWEKYNTDIVDSSTIAARTVSNLLKDREDNTDPFKWINRKYAQDENWWRGVRSIYNDLESNVK